MSNSAFKRVRVFSAYSHGTEYFTFSDDRDNSYVTFTDNTASSATNGKALIWKAARPSQNSHPIPGGDWERGDGCSKRTEGCKMRFGFAPKSVGTATSTGKASTNTDAKITFWRIPCIEGVYMMEEIYAHAGREAPRECCGLVVQDGNNEKYIPFENISTNKDEFEMDGKTFLFHQLNSKIKYVVHSHYCQIVCPSEADKIQCREVGIPVFNRFLSRERLHNYTTMTRNIYLKGRMGKLFGEHHRLNCKTVQEAMHAIDTMKGGLRQYLMDCTENNVKIYSTKRGRIFNKSNGRNRISKR